jgi:hypothetical protein
MSAVQELSGWRKWAAKRLWLLSRWPAVGVAWMMSKVGLHKQIANRILEPWTYISVVMTATEWDNFYSLRCDKEHAHPDIYNLAEMMLAAHNNSTPVLSTTHTPFVTTLEMPFGVDINTRFQMSVARCCRVSYLNHDQTKPDYTKDIALYAQLLKDGHMSPLEHQAIALDDPNARSGNFKGWQQYRKTLPNEERTHFDRLRR